MAGPAQALRSSLAGLALRPEGGPLLHGTTTVRVRTIEEKGSDVNLATNLLWDALHDSDVGTALILSNDSDLQRPIERLMSIGVEVVTVNPHRHRRQRPSLSSSRTLNLRRWHLQRCQMPETVIDARGRTITRPSAWR